MGRKKILLLSLLSVMALCIGWLELNGLPLLFALVPIFYLRTQYEKQPKGSKKLAKRLILIFGVWNLITVWWVANASLLGAVAAVGIGTTLPTITFMVYNSVARRSSKFFSYSLFIVLWIYCEELFMNGQLAFPWLMLGNGFSTSVWAVQWYEYTGAFGGTLWVLLANIFIYEAICSPKDKIKRYSAIAIALLPIALSLLIWITYKVPNQKQALVHIVQPNLDPYTEKFTMSQDAQTQIILSLASQAPRDVDFIITPETAFDDRLWEGALQRSSSMQVIRGSILENYPGAKFIAGATTLRRYYNKEQASHTARPINNTEFYYDAYNSALVVDSSQTIDVYHKNKLVVGVERIPYFSLLKDVEFVSVTLGGMTGQLGYDEQPNIFSSNKGMFATPICYESIYGEYFANLSAMGAELMLLISNDGWWDETLGHIHLLNYARLRAIETRRAVARSANTGISGVISPRGDVLETLGWDQRGTITASVPMDSKVTFYARTGDFIVRISKLVLVLLIALMIGNYIRTKIKQKQ